jgi:hypothetical protein
MLQVPRGRACKGAVESVDHLVGGEVSHGSLPSIVLSFVNA